MDQFLRPGLDYFKVWHDLISQKSTLLSHSHSRHIFSSPLGHYTFLTFNHFQVNYSFMNEKHSQLSINLILLLFLLLFLAWIVSVYLDSSLVFLCWKCTIPCSDSALVVFEAVTFQCINSKMKRNDAQSAYKYTMGSLL